MDSGQLAMGDAHRLDVPYGYNVRDLGGYPASVEPTDPAGSTGMTCTHRFVRSGATDALGQQGIHALVTYGVDHVIDLRGSWELHTSPDAFLSIPQVHYLNVALLDHNLSDPRLRSNDDRRDFGFGLVSGYMTMLSNHQAIQEIFSFCASAQPDSCVLFHCAAGMDRTGVIAMLLLMLAGVDRDHVIADYCYSFASQTRVDPLVFGSQPEKKAHGVHPDKDVYAAHPEKKTDPVHLRGIRALFSRLSHAARMLGNSDAHDQGYDAELAMRAHTIAATYDRLLTAYGSVQAYLDACGVSASDTATVRAHLLS